MFKIFYSWQSDLPSSETKAFIRKCIDEAIDYASDSEAIEAERDEATKGTTGSPDIVATLISKIEDCDMFIADISLCYQCENGKMAPNPNVMLELGYAAKVLGWDRIICLYNADYGKDFPFDINHNRMTDYSLKNSNKKEEFQRISKIIFTNIRDLCKLAPRRKLGSIVHIIGYYDYGQKRVCETILPLKISEQESYVLHNRELVHEAELLVQQIKTIDIPRSESETLPNSLKINVEDVKRMISAAAEEYDKSENYLNSIFERPATIDHIEKEKENITKWTGQEVSDEFFYFGNLKTSVDLFGHDEILIGKDIEKEKYTKLHDLLYMLHQLNVRELFIKSFNDILYIPLAIHNISLSEDKNIRVVIQVLKGDIVEPDETLICEELNGQQGLLCRDEDENNGIGIIDELFCLMEDGTIHLEECSDSTSMTHILPPTIFGEREKDESDYKHELEEYIARSSGGGYYEFEISSLRPNECKWLDRGMLIKPSAEGIEIQYQIYSTYSSGDLRGQYTISCD